MEICNYSCKYLIYTLSHFLTDSIYIILFNIFLKVYCISLHVSWSYDPQFCIGVYYYNYTFDLDL